MAKEDDDVLVALLDILRDHQKRIRELNASISVLRDAVSSFAEKPQSFAKDLSKKEDRARAVAVGAEELHKYALSLSS